MNRKILIVKVRFVCALSLGVLVWSGQGMSLPDPDDAKLTQSPATGQQAVVSDPAKRLESIVVEVNSERRVVDPAQGFAVVLGDLVTIVDAYLVDKSVRVRAVDLVGFRSRISDHPDDDRGRVVDTGRNLSKRRSMDGSGRTYRIEASGQDGLYGAVMMTIQEPELQSFQIEVNGALRTVTPDATLKLSPKDLIRVVDVRTNVRGNENIKFDISPKKGARELRFSRSGRVFARIPIEWQSQ